MASAAPASNWLHEFSSPVLHREARRLALERTERQAACWKSCHDWWMAECRRVGDDESSRMCGFTYEQWNAARRLLSELQSEHIALPASWLVEWKLKSSSSGA